MKSIFSKEKNRGFTLIEVIVSVSILGIVIAVFLPIFPQLISWNDHADDELVSSNLIAQVAHDLKSSSLVNDVETSIQSCPDYISIEQGVLGKLSTYKVNGESYRVDVKVCKEREVDLYRSNIQIFSSTNKLISASYTYVKDNDAGESK